MFKLISSIRKRKGLYSTLAIGALAIFFLVPLVDQRGHIFLKNKEPIKRLDRFPNSNSRGDYIYSQEVSSSERAKNLLKDGKAWYKKRDFKKSNPIFETLVSNYSYKTEVDEAFFLLARGYFELKDYHRSEAIIERFLDIDRGSKWEGMLC